MLKSLWNLLKPTEKVFYSRLYNHFFCFPPEKSPVALKTPLKMLKPLDFSGFFRKRGTVYNFLSVCGGLYGKL
jgi:hypothetical protein